MALPNVLNDLDTHVKAGDVHGAKVWPQSDRLMIRDTAGRSQVYMPAANDDIANKQYVDTKVSQEATARTAAIAAIAGSGNSGVAGLTAQLNAEISARKAADTSLQSQINNIGSGGGSGGSGTAPNLSIYVRTAYIDADGRTSYAPGPPNQANFAFQYVDLHQDATTKLVTLTNVVRWNGSSN